MNKQSIIAPSILSADLARLGEDVENVLKAGADWVHFDVMDNHYVPNLTFGPMLCQSLRDYGITAPIDVHLMINPVDQCIDHFAKAGASVITFHPEASNHVHRSLNLIQSLGCKAGLALNPGTPFSLIKDLVDELDLILVMSVNPGFGGQKFIPSTLKKIQRIKRYVTKKNLNIRIEVDGGINVNNISAVKNAGADTFVAGSAIFNEESYSKTIVAMRHALDEPC